MMEDNKVKRMLDELQAHTRKHGTLPYMAIKQAFRMAIKKRIVRQVEEGE